MVNVGRGVRRVLARAAYGRYLDGIALRRGAIAPLEVRLVDGKFYVPTFPDARRLADHRENPRCAISSWDDAYTAVIVYGIAREVRPDAAGGSAGMVTVEVTPTRIYAIRPPAGQHAAR